MITPLPGISATKPGAAMTPFPGISVEVVDEQGVAVANGQGGYLVITQPWPGMLRTIWGDPDRYRETYWSRFPGVYFAGDGAKRDEDGDLWLLGRVDDVMNVSGHRLSTTEIEHALVSHPKVAEAAVVGASDPTTGQAIVACVTVKSAAEEEAQGAALLNELRDHVAREISPIAKPRQIMLTSDLPKDTERKDHAPAPPRCGRAATTRRRDDSGRPRRAECHRPASARRSRRRLTCRPTRTRIR